MMTNLSTSFKTVVLLMAVIGMGACSFSRGEISDVSGDGIGSNTGSTDRPEGWSKESHSDQVEPNYDVVFPDDEVSQITIIIKPDEWEAMQANMVELFGEAGSEGMRDGFVRGGEMPNRGFMPPGEGEFPEGFQPPEPPQGRAFPEGAFPDQGGLQDIPFRGGDMTSENPMWVSATIEFEGETWNHVGVRYKGNSSLRSGWSSGSEKLPLKLDFDEFEDEYPEIEDQRFYGFKQLSLANGFKDASFLRDAATSQILQEAGLPAAETAFSP